MSISRTSDFCTRERVFFHRIGGNRTFAALKTNVRNSLRA